MFIRKAVCMRRVLVLTALAGVACSVATGASLADFDDLTLAPDSVWSGDYNSDGTGGTYDSTTFASGGAEFVNHSDGDWGVWAGFAYSNEVDTTTSGYLNQYSSFAGGAHSGDNFAVAYHDTFNGFTPTIILDSPMVVEGLYVTNTTYTGLALLDGEFPANVFGGVSGDDPDLFTLTIEGFDVAGATTGTVDFALADYTFADNDLDYVVDTWRYVDLVPLGAVKSLEFSFSSTDIGDFGMNTPAYVAIDTIIPEPASIALLGLGGLLLRRRRRC
jgi:hypothetical protein